MDKAIQELKQLFVRAQYKDALAIAEKLLETTTETTDRCLVLYCCTLCAKYIEDPSLITAYFTQYEQTMPASPSPIEQAQFLHIQTILLFASNNVKEAETLADELLSFVRAQPRKIEFIYIYASTLHHKILYYLTDGQYHAAVKTYNALEENMIHRLEKDVPLLSIQIHGHLTSAYLRLHQWRTAKELLHAMRQTKVLQKGSIVNGHLQIRQHLLNYILDGEPVHTEKLQQLFIDCQPMSRIPLKIFLDDIDALAPFVPTIQSLYEQWQTHLPTVPNFNTLKGRLPH